MKLVFTKVKSEEGKTESYQAVLETQHRERRATFLLGSVHKTEVEVPELGGTVSAWGYTPKVGSSRVEWSAVAFSAKTLGGVKARLENRMLIELVGGTLTDELTDVPASPAVAPVNGAAEAASGS